MKTCTQCKGTKPVTAFRRGQGYKDGIRSECKDCLRERHRRWNRDNPDKVRLYWRRSNAKNKAEKRGYWDPDKTAQYNMRRRNDYLRRKYGITLDEFLDMRDAQGGLCAACGGPPSPNAGPSSGRNDELVVDHDHDTGKVRGLLCNACNRSAGAVGDDPDRLRTVADYLDRFPVPTRD